MVGDFLWAAGLISALVLTVALCAVVSGVVGVGGEPLRTPVRALAAVLAIVVFSGGLTAMHIALHHADCYDSFDRRWDC